MGTWSAIREECQRKLAAGLNFVTLDAQRVLEVEAELAGAAACGQWIPVTERLPLIDSGWVLVLVRVDIGYVHADVTMAHYDYYRDGWRDRWGYAFTGEVTHWRPLPALPEEQGGKNG